MKKIVIISQQGRINHDSIALLTALFPKCEIRMAAPAGQDLEPCPVGSFSRTDMADETKRQSRMHWEETRPLSRICLAPKEQLSIISRRRSKFQIRYSISQFCEAIIRNFANS